MIMPALQFEIAPDTDRATFQRPRPTKRAPKTTPTPPREAMHDFLVPNPRPDLTMDATTLRMLARD